MNRPRVAVVDDEPRLLRSWQGLLGDRYDVSLYESGAQAQANLLGSGSSDVVLLDVQMPDLDGMKLLKLLRTQPTPPEIIMMTGFASVERAVDAMRLGAFDFVSKPVEDVGAFIRKIDLAVEQKRLRDHNRLLEEQLKAHTPTTDLLGESEAVRRTRAMIRRLAGSPASVLIQGESGTGKEVVARALHRLGPRSSGPFIAVNCGAISEHLIESELFGHERGAFTGATNAHVGLFEAAQGGTLLLDEIGDVPLPVQVKLLRALQEKEIRRVGSATSRTVDVRILAATNVDLERAMNEGRFREDLYYRLSTFRLSLQPLRERREDIPLLARHLLDNHARRLGVPPLALSAEVLAQLQSFDWPGNVRQLASALEHAATLTDGSEIGPQHLPSYIATVSPASVTMGEPRPPGRDITKFQDARIEVLESFERSYLLDLMEVCGGNISEGSRRSGIDRANLRRLLKRHQLDQRRH